MTIRHKKDSVGHRGVVPLFAVPNLMHGRASVSSRRRRITWPTGRYAPVVFLGSVDKDRHPLLSLVDGDEDAGAISVRSGFRLSLGLTDGRNRLRAHIGSLVPTHARPVAVCPG